MPLFETSAKIDEHQDHVNSIFMLIAHKLKHSKPLMSQPKLYAHRDVSITSASSSSTNGQNYCMCWMELIWKLRHLTCSHVCSGVSHPHSLVLTLFLYLYIYVIILFFLVSTISRVIFIAKPSIFLFVVTMLILFCFCVSSIFLGTLSAQKGHILPILLHLIYQGKNCSFSRESINDELFMKHIDIRSD